MKIKPFYGFLIAGLAVIVIAFFSIWQFVPKQESFQPGDIQTFRTYKNGLLKTRVGAPFYGDSSFDSLLYFPATPTEIYRADFFPIRNGEILDLMPDRVGYDSHQIAGWVLLKKETWTDTLYVLKDLEEKTDSIYFAPFSDQSNGKTTFGGGRYLDLVIKKGRPVLVDFNYSYNPYCAYKEEYICAKTPSLNALSRSIEAGEKDYDPQPKR